MNAIFVIARNTFKETIRDRILYGIAGFSVLYVAFAILLSKVALGDIAILKSFGLAGMYLFGSVITVFLGSSIISKEIERRTLYFVMAKPVSRSQFVLGKFFGLCAAVLCVLAVMACVYLAVVSANHGGFDALGLAAIGYQALETVIILAVLTFCSVITTPLASTLIAFMALFAGHALGSVMASAQRFGGAFLWFVRFVYYVFPNLEKFDMRGAAAHGISISASSTAFAVVYAVLYSAAMLCLAVAFMKHKEL